MKSQELWPIVTLVQRYIDRVVESPIVGHYGSQRLINAAKSIAGHATALVELLAVAERISARSENSELRDAIAAVYKVGNNHSRFLVHEAARHLGIFWISGHWNEHGEWVPGCWERERPGQRWEEAHWEYPKWVPGRWTTSFGDGGEPRSRQTHGPHATQQGAATPGQGATAQGAVLAAGNVAEPQIDPTAHRVDHPPSPPFKSVEKPQPFGDGDLTLEQLDGMELWDRDVMLDERHRAIGSMLVRRAVAEIRRRRSLETEKAGE